MTKQLTFWFEFASTYSYLTAMRIEPLAKKIGVDLVWKPFLLGPIFQSQGLTTSPFNVYEAKGRYMWQDMARLTKSAGLPFVRPEPFPQNGLLAARVATLGANALWGPDFVRAVYTAHFGAGQSLTDTKVINGVLAKLGLDGDGLIAQAQSDQKVKDALRLTTERASQSGIFGAPSFTTSDGTLFWGNDRLDAALEWEKDHPPRE